LLAGFPCQPFSLAGVSKKNSLGRAHGFDCNTQGTLFFDVERIIEAKRPKAFLLENVKNLASHDKGKTFKVITQTLEEKLGYKIFHKVIDANGFVPQHRQRIFIVGYREDVAFSWNDFLHPGKGSVVMDDILHPENGDESVEPPFTEGDKAEVSKDFIISKKLWAYLQNYKKKHEEKGNGFGYGMVTGEDTCRTLSARYHKDGSEILIFRGKRKNPRRLTPRECARLMGYPDSLLIPVSNTQAYRQFGNSVVVPVIEEIARIMKPHIMELVDRERSSAPIQEEMWQIA
jgi:DNA (cytosine-5)-methyltransferase 1